MEEAACYALGVRVASSYSYAREGGSAFFFIFSPLSPSPAGNGKRCTAYTEGRISAI